MMKYDFVLFANDYQDFIDRVRALGLVDITTSGWESSDSDRDLMLEIEARTKAEATLKSFAQSEEYQKDAESIDPSRVYELYTQTQAKRSQLLSEITLAEKSAEDSRAWGDFSASTLEKLEQSGVELRYFVTNDSQWEKLSAEWSALYTVELISSLEGKSYFVVISSKGEDILLDAQEIKRPTETSTEASARTEELLKEYASFAQILSSLANSVDSIAEEREVFTSKLKLSKVRSSAEEVADGSLLVMSAWAEEACSESVDTLLEEYPGVVYLKSQPTPEDAAQTPVKLTNSWFPRIFEMIGEMYALPKYGTLDLTPLFAPFYMLFFAICLCDAGYGAVILAAGLGIYFKGGKAMRQAAWLSIMCGAAAVAFGLFANSFFGVSVTQNPIMNFQEDFFSISLMIGIVQILLGLAVNIFVTARTFGFKYALGTLGWFMLILTGCISAGLSMAGVTAFGFTSIPVVALIAISLILMLFFNSPGKNIFANFGAGLWNTYNNITGLLSDVLSYIRLFAIGLSGGVLAIVFNSLALGMTGLDMGIEGKPIGGVILSILGASVILLIGHGINLFMSAISSFVHPMRLTFVEFFKNAGFEMAPRKFDPLK